MVSLFRQLLVALGGLLVAVPAWACPACANRGDTGPATTIVLACAIVAPFLVAAVAVPVIRRYAGQGRDADRREAS